MFLNNEVYILCNNFRYENDLNWYVVDSMHKKVPFERDQKIVLFEQSANGNLILCNSRRRHLIKNRVGTDNGLGRRLSNKISIMEKLHEAHSKN